MCFVVVVGFVSFSMEMEKGKNDICRLNEMCWRCATAFGIFDVKRFLHNQNACIFKVIFPLDSFI